MLQLFQWSWMAAKQLEEGYKGNYQHNWEDDRDCKRSNHRLALGNAWIVFIQPKQRKTKSEKV